MPLITAQKLAGGKSNAWGFPNPVWSPFDDSNNAWGVKAVQGMVIFVWCDDDTINDRRVILDGPESYKLNRIGDAGIVVPAEEIAVVGPLTLDGYATDHVLSGPNTFEMQRAGGVGPDDTFTHPTLKWLAIRP